MIEVDHIHLRSPISPRFETWCSGCGEEVELVRIDEAAEIAGTSTTMIIERAAAGEIHMAIRPEALLFCVNSLVLYEALAIPSACQYRRASLSLNH